VTASDEQTRIYVDVCTLCRPYDDQNLMRIRLETDAFYLILQHLQYGRYTMIVSPVHYREVTAIEETRERAELTALLHRYGINPSCDLSSVRQRAEALHARRFGVADAVHVTFAEATADVFITCDDRLLRQCRRASVRVRAMSPIDFCLAEDLR
jgi:predicted nucleic acid-binding protein